MYYIFNAMFKSFKTIVSEESDKFISKEFIGSDVVKIRLNDNIDPNNVVEDLERFFDDIFKMDIHKIIFDLGNIDFPNGSFISMLIGRTSEARRSGGDIRIINLTDTADNNFSIFTPLTYLTICDTTDGILEDFSTMTVMPQEEIEIKDGEPVSIQVEASVESLKKITEFTSNSAIKAGMKKNELSKIKIAVYEACMNVIEHGYKFKPGNSIGVEVLLNNSNFQITISDTGKSFNFDATQPYDVKAAFNEKRRGGFGLYIIKRAVDDVKYESDKKKGNRLILVKKMK
jgi:anti-sigma regulatory factor (Ser/Thr protein kinase)/anti-anti-sigma regulatory factor